MKMEHMENGAFYGKEIKYSQRLTKSTRNIVSGLGIRGAKW